VDLRFVPQAGAWGYHLVPATRALPWSAMKGFRQACACYGV